MIVAPTLDMAQDGFSLGGGTTRPATPPTNTEQASENTPLSHPTTLPNLQGPKRSYCSHDDHPGVPYELIIKALSSHFDSLWDSYHEPKEDDYESDDENDMPVEYDDFESAFRLGDIVRVESDTTNAWAEHIPGLDGYYSKQAFKIIGKSLIVGAWWMKKLEMQNSEARARKS